MSGSVIIIGSGLGGLECGYILSRYGFRVTVLEKHSKIGGCLQTFRRLGRDFDTGFHCVGGLGQGQPLNTLFRYFDLMDLPWVELSKDCSDKIYIGEEVFCLPSGYEPFVDSLSERFPSQRENLHKWVCLLKHVGDNIFDTFQHGPSLNPLLQKSAYEYLQETITDPLLRDVLSSFTFKMEFSGRLPLYEYAQINSSFIQSSWRLLGGGDQIAERLRQSIESCGGSVFTNAEVVRMEGDGERITSVELSSGERLSADWVISDVHPAVTMDLIGESHLLRKAYRKRLSSLKNTYGAFTSNVCLKEGTVRYQNNNVYIHRANADLWNVDPSKTDSVMIHFYPPQNGSEFAAALDIISPMSFDSVSPWQDLPVGRRGKAYDQLKAQKQDEMMDLVEDKIEGLKDGVEAVFTSTPLTYLSYTGTPQGSAFGVCKDCENPLTTMISTRSPLRNLLFTGQNLNLHGVLGVSMTSIMTCANILGMDILRKEIMGK